jgi:hypothetical protein
MTTNPRRVMRTVIPKGGIAVSASPPPNISPLVFAETQFMQNYRIASPVNPGGDSVAVNGGGQVELFTVGTNGMVWNLYPDPTSDTGYSFSSTGLTATTIAAGVDGNGRIVVFGASATNPANLYYVYELASGAGRWSSALPVPLPEGPTWGGIEQIVVQEIAGSLYVALLAQLGTAGTAYRLVWSNWDTDSPALTMGAGENVPWNLPMGVLVGNSAATAGFGAFRLLQGASPTQYYWNVWNFAEDDWNNPPSSPLNDLPEGLAAVNDGEGNTQVFYLQDGELLQLASPPISLSEPFLFQQIAADIDTNGTLHVFAAGTDHTLYHWESTTGGPPTPLYASVASIAVAANDAGAIDAFAVGTAQNTLTHLYRDSLDWIAQVVEVPTNGVVEEYISYSTDLYLNDSETYAPLINQPVFLTALEACRLSINGGVYFLSGANTITVSTNAAGLLSIAQETGSLAVPDISLTVAGVEWEPFGQYFDVGLRLSTVTEQQLQTAQDASGLLLGPDQQGSAGALASACNNLLFNIKDLSGANGKRPRHLARPGGRRLRPRSTPGPRRITPSTAPQHWQVTFLNGKMVYRALTGAEAAALIAEKRGTLQSAGLLDWLDDIGDFIETVREGLVDLTDTVVNGVEATITFVFDGITYHYYATVGLVEQVFDLIEVYFAYLAVTFEELFEWLGQLFSWNDIVRTHEALVYTITQFLGFVSGSAAQFQTLVDSNFANFQGGVSAAFQQAITTVGSWTITNVGESAPSVPPFSAGASNNIVFNGFIDNSPAASVSSVNRAGATDSISTLMQQISSFAQSMESNPAFVSATTFFENIGGGPDQIFTQTLQGLLQVAQALVQAALTGAQAVVDALLPLMAEAVQGIEATLQEAWDIPFVSAFYAWITNGEELTTLDLICLIAAIPATILYKLLNQGAAPFPDEASVSAFEASFSSTTMLQAAGLAPANAPRIALGEGGLLPLSANVLMQVGAAAFTTYAGGLTAVLDALPLTTPTTPILTGLSWASFGLSVGAQACAFPWFNSAGAIDCSSAGLAYWLWQYQTIGLGVDAVFLLEEDVLPDNYSESSIGVAFTSVYGAMHLGLAVVASVPSGNAPYTWAGNLVPGVPEFAKLFRLQTINMPNISSAVDVFFYAASALLVAVTPLGSDDGSIS